MQFDTKYTILFAAAVCIVCSIFVASSAVSLRPRQELNKALDLQKKVLTLAGVMEPGESLSNDEVQRRYAQSIEPFVIVLKTGEDAVGVDPATFDQRAAAKDPATSVLAPPNPAKVLRLPDDGLVYHVMRDGKLAQIIVPIYGYGLWSFMYGLIAIDPDSRTIGGITFYEHGETPGLGGEIDNPRWQASWKGRLAFNDKWQPAISVKKGTAGPPDQDPYQVDGLSGATITSRGVTNTVDFWLGDDGYGPYLARYRSERGIQ